MSGEDENMSGYESGNADDAGDLTCFFCSKVYISRKKRKIYCYTVKKRDKFLTATKAMVTKLNVLDFLQKIEDKKFTSDTICYHGPCKFKYFDNHQRAVNKSTTDEWSVTRNFNKMALKKLIEYLDEEIIENGRIISLSNIKNVFVEFLEELYRRI